MSVHSLKNLSASQFRQAATLRARIDKLEAQLGALLGGSAAAAPAGRRRRFSASTRAKMAAAQRARWAKRKSGK